MGLFVEETGLIVTHLLYTTAVNVLAVLRWILSWALTLLRLSCFKDYITTFFFTFTFTNSTDSSISQSQSQSQSRQRKYSSSSSSSSSSSLVNYYISCQMIRDSLVVTSFEEAKQRLPWVSDTCAVCLSQLSRGDDVRELSNCCHVFHKDCIDRWVDYHHQHHQQHDQYDRQEEDDDHRHHNNHNTCPLCRAPLLAAASYSTPKNQPSWAVERLLYLFGDDLLP